MGLEVEAGIGGREEELEFEETAAEPGEAEGRSEEALVAGGGV
jgi:hypothetical protein